MSSFNVVSCVVSPNCVARTCFLFDKLYLIWFFVSLIFIQCCILCCVYRLVYSFFVLFDSVTLYLVLCHFIILFVLFNFIWLFNLHSTLYHVLCLQALSRGLTFSAFLPWLGNGESDSESEDQRYYMCIVPIISISISKDIICTFYISISIIFPIAQGMQLNCQLQWSEKTLTKKRTQTCCWLEESAKKQRINLGEMERAQVCGCMGHEGSSIKMLSIKGFQESVWIQTSWKAGVDAPSHLSYFSLSAWSTCCILASPPSNSAANDMYAVRVTFLPLCFLPIYSCPLGAG